MAQQRHHVVILGAGFGGLETVKTLSRAPVEISVIDRQNYHCFQPLLYQVAIRRKSLGPSVIFCAGNKTSPYS